MPTASNPSLNPADAVHSRSAALRRTRPVLFVALSIFPIIDVDHSSRYSLKIAGVVLGANFLGWTIYRAGQRKRERSNA